MRYLVKARIKPGRHRALLRAIEDGSLGRGSVAGNEYQDNMREARVAKDGAAHWVETCFCETPLGEERPYWEQFFDILSIKDAHSRKKCRDLNGSEAWACCDCDCTRKLEDRLRVTGASFLENLKSNHSQ